MNINFSNNYNSYLGNSNFLVKNFSPINLKIVKVLYFNYGLLIKSDSYLKNFFLKFYFYFLLLEFVIKTKPFVRKIKFLSLPQLKKQKFYNFKLILICKVSKLNELLDFFDFLFLFKSLAKSLFSVFATRSCFLLKKKGNLISLNLLNSHYLVSFFQNYFIYLKNSSIKINFYSRNAELSTFFFNKMLYL